MTLTDAQADKLHALLRRCYPHYKTDELALLVQINIVQDLVEKFKDFGIQDYEINEIFPPAKY